MSFKTTQSAQFRSLIVTAPALAAYAACVFAAALAMVALPAGAALYKWTDANGRVIYSDQPPAGNVKVEQISGPPPPVNPNAAKELAAKEAEVQQKKILRADADVNAAKARTEANRKREQCASVRGQIAMLQPDQNQNVVLYKSNEKGQPVYLDDTARRRERERLEVLVREYCTN